DNWKEQIQKAMEECDLALLMISPAFLASDFIRKVELPYLLEHKRVIPVALKPISLNRAASDIQAAQIFYHEKKPFIDCTTGRTQEAFALQLFERICKVQRAPAEPVKPRFEHHLRNVISDFDEARFVHTEGVATTMAKGLETPQIDP